jgi:hypothetical protein
MGDLRVIKDQENWEVIQKRLVVPSVFSDFMMVHSGELLFFEDSVQAEAAVYEENGNILFYPYLRRPCPYIDDMFDICSAYEFGGFWFSSTDFNICSKLVKGFESSFREYAFRSNIVSEFIRINPLCEVDQFDWRDYEIYKNSDHIVIPIMHGEDKFWKSIDKKKRNEFRRSEKNNLKVEFSDNTQDFISIYYRRLDALNSYRFYYFPEEYIRKLDSKIILYVYDQHNEICGAQIWLKDGNNLFYFLSADVAEKKQFGPTTFGIINMVKWAYKNKIENIHLGGGTETLFNYKSKFSLEKISYFLGKRIINQEAYNYMVKAHEDKNGQLGNKEYFPLYRLDTDESHKIPNKRRYTGTQTLS